MKKIIILLMGLFFLFSGFYLYSRIDRPPTKKTIEKISVYQSITTKGKTNFKIYEISKENTALDLLRKHAKVETKGEGKNAYVISINETKALSENKEYWAFYVNEKMAEVGAGSYKLKEGDRVEWRVEKY